MLYSSTHVLRKRRAFPAEIRSETEKSHFQFNPSTRPQLFSRGEKIAGPPPYIVYIHATVLPTKSVNVLTCVCGRHVLAIVMTMHRQPATSPLAVVELKATPFIIIIF